MLQELAEYLVNTGKQTVDRKVIDHPNDPDRRLVIGPDGVTPIDTPRQPPKQVSKCYTVDDFAKCIASRAGELTREVWYDEKSAVIYSDDVFRKDSVSIEFPPHPVLKQIRAFQETLWLDQKGLIRMLRITFSGLVEEQVLIRFRQLNWESARRVRQTISHGKSSLDSEVQASVTAGDSEVEERFRLEFPLFADSTWGQVKHAVTVAVDLDVEQSRIGLCLLPGAVDEIVQAQRRAVHGFLSAALGELHDGEESEYELICGETKLA